MGRVSGDGKVGAYRGHLAYLRPSLGLPSTKPWPSFAQPLVLPWTTPWPYLLPSLGTGASIAAHHAAPAGRWLVSSRRGVHTINAADLDIGPTRSQIFIYLYQWLVAQQGDAAHRRARHICCTWRCQDAASTRGRSAACRAVHIARYTVQRLPSGQLSRRIRPRENRALVCRRD